MFFRLFVFFFHFLKETNFNATFTGKGIPVILIPRTFGFVHTQLILKFSKTDNFTLEVYCIT